MTPWVKRLLIANTVVFLASVLVRSLEPALALYPQNVLTRPWGIVTYMFMHGDVLCTCWSTCWVCFSSEHRWKPRWGSREFIKFYFICGLGGALLSILFGFFVP